MENLEIPVTDDVGNRKLTLKVLQGLYSDMLNEYERQIDEVAALGRVSRNTLYNPAVLHEIESMAYRRKFEELLSAVWIAQSQLGDIIALQRTVCVLKRSMSEEDIVSTEKVERDIDHQALPYETI
ncbi:MAG: hypothetical protein NT131_07985 [Methanomassiliicoccales archaeon]|nr:hypothetical protein [Methanomassiliicoccales archaeon]